MAAEVHISSTNSPVDQGGTITVSYTVSSTDANPLSGNATLVVNGNSVDTSSHSVEGFSSSSGLMSWSTTTNDLGTYSATVSWEGASDSTGVEVQDGDGGGGGGGDPAAFDVAIDHTAFDTTVTEGDQLNVRYLVTNTGGETDNQDITLDVPDGTTRDIDTPVILDPDETQSAVLQWDTLEGDSGTYTAHVSSETDTDTTSVTVEEEPYFDVTLVSTNSPVVEGDTLDVTYTVSNTGDASDTQSITLDVGGQQRDSDTRTVSGGSSSSGTLSWNTSNGDAGSYTATVASDDDTDTSSVTIQEDTFFDVTIDSTNSPVNAGGTLDVNYTVSNTGDASDTQSITLDVGGQQRDSDTRTVSGGSSSSGTLSWNTNNGDAGSYTAVVASDDDSDSQSVSIQSADPPNFTVSIDSTNSPVNENQTLNVNCTINNTGDASDTQNITLSTGGGQRDSQSVSLGGSQSTSITLSWNTNYGDAGSYTATVESEDDTDTTSVSVNAVSFVTVTIDSTNSPVLGGETLDVDYTATNHGSASASPTITLDVGGQQRDSDSPTISGESSTSGTLSWTTTTNDVGDYTATVSSNDDSDSTSVSVNINAPEPVAIRRFAVNGTTYETALADPTDSRLDYDHVRTAVDGQVLCIDVVDPSHDEATPRRRATQHGIVAFRENQY